MTENQDAQYRFVLASHSGMGRGKWCLITQKEGPPGVMGSQGNPIPSNSSGELFVSCLAPLTGPPTAEQRASLGKAFEFLDGKPDWTVALSTIGAEWTCVVNDRRGEPIGESGRRDNAFEALLRALGPAIASPAYMVNDRAQFINQKGKRVDITGDPIE